MGKLLSDSITWWGSTTVNACDLSEPQAAATSWDRVSGMEEQQWQQLLKLHAKGVQWTHPEDKSWSMVFRLSHGGDVEADGNCLFTASWKAMVPELKADGEEVLGSLSGKEREMTESAIRHMYALDLKSGWGIHLVQEVKSLAKKADRESLDSAINELVNLSMQRETAAESIYKEKCIAVDNGPSWARYMSISGSPEDEYDIITLQYTEGLLTIDENREGHAAAFGDDIAIGCLATEFKREIFVLICCSVNGVKLILHSCLFCIW
ncbi:hypothetical protein Ancab_018240 [Ancistrocladus abbreviatus]